MILILFVTAQQSQKLINKAILARFKGFIGGLMQKPYVIAVTGTPCTGKTSLAKELAKQTGFKYIDGNLIIRKYGLSEGFDRFRRSKIVDSKRFSKAAVRYIKTDFKARKVQNKALFMNKRPIGYVFDSHMSHFLPLSFVNCCIVTKTSIKQLNKRLTLRYVSKNWPIKVLKTKIRENLDSEILETCLIEAKEAGHKIIIADTTKTTPKTLAKHIILRHLK